MAPSLIDHTSYRHAQRHFDRARLWALFDGDREHLNITHECVDRHPGERIAVRVAHADGRDEEIGFEALARTASRVAHWLIARGVASGERVAIMLEPGLAFYASLFGAMKAGAVAVPLFTLFGPDGLAARVRDCRPRLLILEPGGAGGAGDVDGVPIVSAPDLLDACADLDPEFAPLTRADDMAMYQYTSGTSRMLAEAVRHRHRAVVTVAVAALYATGVRPGDRFMCPSSPAWGHGLWHGTLAPLGLGVSIAAYAGRFDPERLMQALEDYRIDNLSAAATHYRMMRNAGTASDHRFAIRKLSFTGEPLDAETAIWIESTFEHPACSIYGTTEVGVVLAQYPAADDLTVKPGSLGVPVPGLEVAVHDPAGRPCPPDEVGEIVVRRGETWIATKDRGHVDADGHFYHDGRADDIIISAGWTLSPKEIEDVLLAHPQVREAAAVGVPDPTRGQIVAGFVVVRDPAAPGLASALQAHVRNRLSAHAYPRRIEIVEALPKTPAGKINRRALRESRAPKENP